MAVTADEPLRSELHSFAASLGGIPFDLRDADRTTYHAAAAAAANFPTAAFAIAQRLLESTGVPFDAVRPLVDRIVANAFELGPRASLTGPIARGDVDTIEAQVDAVRSYGSRSCGRLRGHGERNGGRRNFPNDEGEV